jgi:succinate-acetate transporter protein
MQIGRDWDLFDENTFTLTFLDSFGNFFKKIFQILIGRAGIKLNVPEKFQDQNAGKVLKGV